MKNTFKEEQQKLYSKVLVGDQEDQGEDRPQEEEEEGDQNEDGPLEDYTPRPLEDCSLRLQEEKEERGSETPMKDQ